MRPIDDSALARVPADAGEQSRDRERRWVECLILAANRGRCPLTGVAARYTEQRTDNFDIYLPLWLARWNKAIFGVIFVAGVLFVLARCLTS
jgi:hypothetical protein